MHWEDFAEREIGQDNSRETAAVAAFLAQFGLAYEPPLDYTVALYQGERIVATGSLAGKVLRNIAVSEDIQGEGLTAAIVSSLVGEAGRRGIYHYFIYTRPGSAAKFAGLAFREIARAEPYAALLEGGLGSVDDFCRAVKAETAGLPAGRRAALVVNCNPFTRGHEALIARAAAENDGVIVFVVSEDRSLFPFAVRLRLVREGTAHLANVAVVSGGDYIISAATFPAYFTRGEEAVAAQTRLDATLFATRLAPPLGIMVRYVGEEPYCAVTAAYNRALGEILPRHGVAVKVAARFEAGGEVVSASKVREMIRREDWAGVKTMVPETTYAYLRSAEAGAVLAGIKRSEARH
jgi:[citrate (pro-3S)-lyase] ligase